MFDRRRAVPRRDGPFRRRGATTGNEPARSGVSGGFLIFRRSACGAHSFSSRVVRARVARAGHGPHGRGSRPAEARRKNGTAAVPDRASSQGRREGHMHDACDRRRSAARCGHSRPHACRTDRPGDPRHDLTVPAVTRRPALALLLLASAAILPAGCGASNGVVCTAIAAAGLSVSVTNARTSAPVCDATVTATEGSYSERLQPIDCKYVGAIRAAGHLRRTRRGSRLRREGGARRRRAHGHGRVPGRRGDARRARARAALVAARRPRLQACRDEPRQVPGPLR
jgi:hypothetical protein